MPRVKILLIFLFFISVRREHRVWDTDIDVFYYICFCIDFLDQLSLYLPYTGGLDTRQGSDRLNYPPYTVANPTIYRAPNKRLNTSLCRAKSPLTIVDDGIIIRRMRVARVIASRAHLWSLGSAACRYFSFACVALAFPFYSATQPRGGCCAFVETDLAHSARKYWKKSPHPLVAAQNRTGFDVLTAQ